MKSRATTGAEIVEEAHELITGARQADYNHPTEDYGRTVDTFNALTGRNLNVEEAVLFMTCMKLSRLMNELQTNQWIPDNTRDAIGYLGCLNMVRTRDKQENRS
jgi:hypothetical protein